MEKVTRPHRVQIFEPRHKVAGPVDSRRLEITVHLRGQGAPLAILEGIALGMAMELDKDNPPAAKDWSDAAWELTKLIAEE